MDALELIDLKRDMRRIEQELRQVKEYGEQLLKQNDWTQQTLDEFFKMWVQAQEKAIKTSNGIETFAEDKRYCEVCDIHYPEDEPCRLH